jgi:colanic acid biosynthesis glycosyl transferase WcaI
MMLTHTDDRAAVRSSIEPHPVRHRADTPPRDLQAPASYESKKLRIITWGINYLPEKVGIAPCNAALCEFLAEAGHEVTMLTSFPYYPAWHKEAEDANRLFASGEINGVRVERCWHYVPRPVNTWERVLHELSFVVTSFFRSLFLSKPDLLIVVSPPLLLGVAARVLCWLRGSRYIVHIQDLQPDAAIQLGMIGSRRLITLLKFLESAAYGGASRISAISDGMLDLLQNRGVPTEKLVYLPNGTRPAQAVNKGKFREMNGFDPDNFLIVYSGNIGVKQGLSKLIEAAEELRDTSIQFIICGDGAERERLVDSARELGNVHFKALLEEREYQEMLADADLLVISQVSAAGSVFFPSKFVSSCSAGRPVLAICDPGSELANVVQAHRCGVVVPPDGVPAIAEALRALVKEPKQLTTMGEAANRVGKQFLWNRVLGRFVIQLGTIGGGRDRSQDLHIGQRHAPIEGLIDRIRSPSRSRGAGGFSSEPRVPSAEGKG